MLLLTTSDKKRYVYLGSSSFIYGLAHNIPLLFSNIESVEIMTQVEGFDCKYVEDPVYKHMRVVL